MKKYFIILCILTISLFAVDIDEVDIGDIYYINGYLNEDRRVVVVKINRSRKKVKVRAQNGDTEWVHSSELLTKNQNENMNSYGPIVAGIAVLAGLATLADDTGSSNSNDGYGIYVKNNCSQTMRLAIQYLPANKNEVATEYWWKFKPGRSAYLYSNDTKLLTTSSALYYYAIGENGYEIDGYHKVFFDGKKRWMKKLVDKSGDTDIVLNCN